MFEQFAWAEKIRQSSDRGLIWDRWVESDLFEQFAWAEKILQSSDRGRKGRVRGAIDRCDVLRRTPCGTTHQASFSGRTRRVVCVKTGQDSEVTV